MGEEGGAAAPHSRRRFTGGPACASVESVFLKKLIQLEAGLFPEALFQKAGLEGLGSGFQPNRMITRLCQGFDEQPNRNS